MRGGSHPTFAELDRITEDELRRSGGLKWATDEGATGAFVAEMDFGVAPAVTRALHAAVDEGLFAYLPPRYRTGLQRAASASSSAPPAGTSLRNASTRCPT